MKNVKLTPEDMPAVKEIYRSVVDAFQNLPLSIFNSDKFGLMVVQALLNMVCEIANKAGATKEILIDAVEQIWDGKFDSNSMLN